MMPWQPQQLLDFAYTSEISQLLEMQYDTESDSEEANEPMEVDTVNSTADASETGNSTEADSDWSNKTKRNDNYLRSQDTVSTHMVEIASMHLIPFFNNILL